MLRRSHIGQISHSSFGFFALQRAIPLAFPLSPKNLRSCKASIRTDQRQIVMVGKSPRLRHLPPLLFVATAHTVLVRQYRHHAQRQR
jgi:hypothetical protein